MTTREERIKAESERQYRMGLPWTLAVFRAEQVEAVGLLADELWKWRRVLEASGLPKTDANPIALAAIRKAQESQP